MKYPLLFAVTATVLFACQPTENASTSEAEGNAAAPTELQDQVDASTRRLDSLNNLIKDDAFNLDVLEARAQEYLRRQNLRYAAADIAAVLAEDSTRLRALELWGDLGFATNKTRESRDAWTKCMQQDPTYVPCRLKMAELYHIVTEFEKSAKLVDEVLSLDPKNPEAHFLKGLLMRDALADTARALEWFQRAIDLDNDYLEALDMCGVLYSVQGNPLALGYFNRLLELEPESRNFTYNRGAFYMGQNRWNEAIEDFTRCVQLDPRDIESMFNLGYIHLQLKVYNTARDYFSQAISVQPVNHRAYYGRGYAHEMLGDVTNAARDYETALSYNPNHRGSQEGLRRTRN